MTKDRDIAAAEALSAQGRTEYSADETRLLQAGVDALADQLRTYEPLRERVRRLDALVDDEEEIPPLRTASDVLGDRAFYAFCVLRGDQSGYQGQPEFRLDFARTILDAVPVLWLDDMFQIALALELPEHVIAPDVLPYPVMWWVFDADRGSENAPIHAFILMVNEQAGGFTAVLLGLGADAAEIQIIARIDVEPLERFVPGGDHAKAIVLQMLAFMNSRFVEAEEVRLTRAERHRLKRAGTAGPLARDAVHTIKVRAPEPTAADRAATGHTAREWSRRWIVRGHYRAQWYGSIQAHRVRWIAPYVKGPADKDLVLPVVTVGR